MGERIKLPILASFLFLSCAIPFAISVGTIDPYILLGGSITVLLAVILLMLKDRSPPLLAGALLVSLFLIPNVTVSGINLRFDDYITVFLFFYLISLVMSGYSFPLKKQISVYVGYSILISVINIAFASLNPIYMLFLFKEIQYYVYFAIMFVIGAKYFGQMMKLIYGLAIANILWGAYQLLSGNEHGYYGIGIISSTAPSHSGVMYFIILVFFIYQFEASPNVKLRFLNAALILAAFSMAVATISRISILTACVIIFLYLVMLIVTFRITTTRVIVAFYVLAAAVPLAWSLIDSMVHRIIARLDRIQDGAETRQEHWDYFLSYTDAYSLIFGKGKGFLQFIVGHFTLAADNQYVRNIIEVGAIGSAMWFAIVASILWFSFKHRKTNYRECLFLFLLTTGFLVMSYTHEAFLVSIQASLYWILTGLLMGKVISNNKAVDNAREIDVNHIPADDFNPKHISRGAGR